LKRGGDLVASVGRQPGLPSGAYPVGGGDFTPRQVVAELDKYIVGQHAAKRAVAIALRNRYRRRRLPEGLREEIYPKNILMIGPTGVGKTEIARRLARLVNAPFTKVEATRFTEVGYVGRDVESMVRDLVETAIRMVRAEKTTAVEDQAARLAEERLLDLLAPLPQRDAKSRGPLEALFGAPGRSQDEEGEYDRRLAEAQARRQEVKRRLAAGELEDQVVEVELEDSSPPMLDVLSGQGAEEIGVNLQELFGGLLPRRKKRRKVEMGEARRLLTQEEAQKLVDMEQATSEAIGRVEQSGIIFIDEIDKIAGREYAHGPDVSREGVQRDILPIVEGSTIMTKHGAVKSDHILFIAAGAFHTTKPSDLIPELQGRFPIRVELDNLTEEDFCRILTEPENALITQYRALLAADGVDIVFRDDAVAEIARVASSVNERTENIGARRLHTVMEKLLEDLSFAAPDDVVPSVTIDADYVKEVLADITADDDLARYIL